MADILGVLNKRSLGSDMWHGLSSVGEFRAGMQIAQHDEFDLSGR
jgi:hypothetical protein